MILRDRDANTDWDAQADGTLEERTYYCQNWRADVVALFDDAGRMLQQVRYDPYGVPFGVSKADINADGVRNTQDTILFGNLWNSGNGTHVFADWNFDGSVNTADYTAFLNSYNADTALGRGVLSYAYSTTGGANRKGYAGYELDPGLATAIEGWEGWYHVRHRVYVSHDGTWTRRDPLGYNVGANLFYYVSSKPNIATDPSGLVAYDCRDYGTCGEGGGNNGGDSAWISATVSSALLIPELPIGTANSPQPNSQPWFGCSDSLFCYKLFTDQNWKENQKYATCAGTAGWSFGADVAKCAITCIPFALYGGPAGYGVCMAGCVGMSGVIGIWTVGKCWDHLNEQLQYNLNTYCACLNKRARCPLRSQRGETMYAAVNCNKTTTLPKPLKPHPDVPQWPDHEGPIDIK